MTLSSSKASLPSDPGRPSAPSRLLGLQPARDRLGAGPLHHRPGRGQARGRGRPAQPLAAPAAARGAARGGPAQEHPDDRADRRRQDRDRPASRQAGPGALRQGRGDQVHRGRLCRARRGADGARPGRDRAHHDPRAPAQGGQGQGRAGRRGAPDRRPGRRQRPRRHPDRVPPAPAHRRPGRPGGRDRGRRQRRAVPADHGHPRHARRQHGHGQPQRHLRQGLRQPHQEAAPAGGRGHAELLDRPRRATSCSDQETITAEAINTVEQNGIVFLDEIDKITARSPSAPAPTSAAKGVQRDLLPLDRGHHRGHQARRGEDRFYPLHRLRRVPSRQALGPAAGTPGPPAHPGRAQRARAARTSSAS